MLFKAKIFVIILLSSTYFSSGQESLLWKVSGNGLNEASFVYGTFHLPISDLLKANKKLDSVKNIVSSACFEVIASTDSNLVLQQNMVAVEGNRVSDLFSGDTLKQVYNAIPLPVSAINALKPIAIVTYTISKILPTDGVKGMDVLFQEEFKSMGKPIFGLEYYREQIKMLGLFNKSEIRKELIDLTYNKDSVQQEMMGMLNAYMKQSISFLDSVSRSELPSRLVGPFLDDRNVIMVKRMLPKMRNNSTLVCVGAAHLGGQMGVVNLLRKAGYSVEPIL